jgi:hypothetical protein
MPTHISHPIPSHHSPCPALLLSSYTSPGRGCRKPRAPIPFSALLSLWASSPSVQPGGAAPSLQPSAGNSSQPTNKRRHPNPNLTLGSQCCPPLWSASISLALLTLTLGARHQICATPRKPPPTLFSGRLGYRNFLTTSPQFLSRTVDTQELMQGGKHVTDTRPGGKGGLMLMMRA